MPDRERLVQEDRPAGCTENFCVGVSLPTRGVIIRATTAVRRGHLVYRFGDFELHPHSARLLRAGERVQLNQMQLATLIQLVVAAPDVVCPDVIARVAWGGATSRNSIEKAIAHLRKALGHTVGASCIVTVPNQGYRFAAAVEETDSFHAPVVSGVDDDPYRLLEVCRRELASLSRSSLAAIRRRLETALQAAPDNAEVHVMLAMACALTFEATRFDAGCDFANVRRAVGLSRRGVTLDPASPDAWSTLGFALCLAGETGDAVVNARKAVDLDRRIWRHWLRLAYVSWGDQRMEAARNVLLLQPRLAFSYWLRATVLIARGAFEATLSELRDGCAAQDQQPAESPAFPGLGLYLLRGLVLAAQNRTEEAVRALETELAAPHHDQIYSQECLANTWYALGAIHLRQRAFPAADTAFHRALDIAPAHVYSMAALGRPIPDTAADDPRRVDAAIARAVALARGNRHTDAAATYANAVDAARASNAGWLLPVEPVLHPMMRPDAWASVLTKVQQNAT